MMRAKRIGAYGGTFDPIHCGHLEIARVVVERFALDTLLLIPAYKPPHKSLDAIAEAEHRYAMTALAIEGEPRLAVSRLEIDAPERPYTVQTMARLRESYGLHVRLFFVMGADSFQDLTKWHEYERLLASTNLIVVTRPGHSVAADHLPEAARRRVLAARQANGAWRLPADGEECFIYVIDDVWRDISSTEIRRRRRAAESIEGLVPERVRVYIEEHQLYRQNL